MLLTKPEIMEFVNGLSETDILYHILSSKIKDWKECREKIKNCEHKFDEESGIDGGGHAWYACSKCHLVSKRAEPE